MRILFKLVFFAIILIAMGLVALVMFVDPNDYRPEISEQVEKATGRKLTLSEIKLSVFPWVALKLGPLSLSNAKGFKAETFAKVNATEVRVKLMPLLKKKLEMDTIILDGLTLNLEKNKAGKTNWDDLTAKGNDEDADSSNDTAGGKPALAAINIAGVKLTNANIIWDDASTSERYQLNNFNLTTDPLIPGEPVDVDMDFDLGSKKPQVQAHIGLTSKIMIDLDSQQYSLSNLTFTTQAKSKELPFSTADIALKGDINADMMKQLISVGDLALTVKANKDNQVANIVLKGDVNADMAKQLVSIDGLDLTLKANKDNQVIDASLSSNVSTNLATQQSTLKTVNLTAVITDPSMPGGKANIKLSTDIAADMKKQTVSLSKLVLQIQELLVNGDLKASKILSDSPNIAGNIAVNPFNLRQLANQLAIELPVMADSSTLELVKLTTKFTASNKHFNAQNLAVTLDQTKLTGQFGVSNFSDPAINFKLVLDDIDVDRYLPPSTEKAPDAKPVPNAENSDDKLPLEALRGINAKGTFDIGKLKISGTHSNKIHLEINANKGLIKLSPLSANMYQGQYKGNVNLDARGKTLKLSLNENLKGVNVEPLLNDLNGEAKLAGAVNAQVKLIGNGATVAQIKQTLSGNGNFTFTDGAIKGLNIAESIRKAKAALGGKKASGSDAPVQTDFSSLTGTFVAKNGVITNKDLLVKSPLLRVDGHGDIDLPKENLNYNVNASIVGSTKGQGGEELSSLKGLTIPIKITGSFDNPKPTVDLASMIRNQASDEIKSKVSDKLKDKLGGKLGGLLGGALGVETEKPATTEQATPKSNAPEADAPKKVEPKKSVEDQAKDALKDKLKGFF